MYTMHYDHSHKTAVPTELLQDPYLSVDTKGLAAILCSFGKEGFELSALTDQLRDNLSDERTFRALSAHSWSFTTCAIWMSGKRATTSI